MPDTDHTQIASNFHRKLDDLQFGRSRADARFFLVQEEALEFADNLSRRMLVVQLAYVLNRTLIMKAPEEPAYPEYYRPVSNYTYDDVAGYPAPIASFDIEQSDKVVRFDFDAFWANDRLRRFFYPWAPQEYTRLHCARLIFDGDTLLRFRLKEEIALHVEEAKERIGFSTPVAGLYLGGGSQFAYEPDAPQDVLFSHASAICADQNIDRVLVAGNADGTPAALPSAQNIEFVDVDVTDEGPLAPLLELELLSMCDWIVGRETSYIPRMAAARIGARTMRCDRHRLVSLDTERRGFRRLFAKR